MKAHKFIAWDKDKNYCAICMKSRSRHHPKALPIKHPSYTTPSWTVVNCDSIHNID